MAKYTVDEAKELHAEAVRLKLIRSENLADPVRVAEVCNGIGADWMPPKMRDLADALSPAMKLAAAIHDVDYANGGDDGDRLAADVIFRANCTLCINAMYAWYNPWRYVMLARAERYYDYLRAFGGLAFNYAKNEASQK